MADKLKWYMSVPALVAFSATAAVLWAGAVVDPGRWTRWPSAVIYTGLVVSLVVQRRRLRKSP